VLAFEAIVSGFSYAAQALLLAVLVTAGFLLPSGKPKEMRQALILSSAYLLLAFLIIAATALLIQGCKLQGGRVPSGETLLRYATLTQSGRIWLGREIFAVLLAAVAFRISRQPNDLLHVRLLGFAVVPLLAGRSFMSHAVAVRNDTVLAVSADATHLVATSLWAGGLPVLAAVLYSGKKHFNLPLAWAGKLVARFSRLALVSVAVLVVTGVYGSWIQVGHLNTFLETDYGNVLLIKIMLAVAMIGLGAINFFWTRRKLSGATNESAEKPIRKQVLTLVGTEGSLAVVVFFVTGVLTVLPPGVHALHQTAIASSKTISLAPAEGASVSILSPTPGQVFTTDSVPLSFTLVKGKHGDHVHAYVDGELMGMFESTTGTLNGIRPGRHDLELRVVAEDHQTELDAKDRSEFIVKETKEDLE
jgi:copper transport protein